MNELSYICDPVRFREALRSIRQLRRDGKIKSSRLYRLTKGERVVIHSKTGGKCHVCGRDVNVDKFEADHIKSHSSGGTSITDNFLPACRTCNNYRWHYLPDEFQWILKLGVWARTEIERDSKLGKLIACSFINKEITRESRRKVPREHLEQSM